MAKNRWPLAQAEEVAGQLVVALSPYCSSVVVAGSIRRRQEEVGDIELLCVPMEHVDSPTAFDSVEAGIRNLIESGELDYRRNKRGAINYGPLNKFMVHRSGIAVDVFSTTAKNFGMALVVRTGPKAWNIRMMRRFRELGMEGHAYAGISLSKGQEVNCPDEDAVFRYLGWRYVPPEKRV